MKGRILVYSLTGCPFCARAKSAIADLGLDYVTVDVEKYPDAAAKMKEQTGRQTVPQIFFNEVHVGGYDDLEKLIENKKKLNSLIDKVKNHEPGKGSPVPPSEDSKTVQSDGGAVEFLCEPDEFDQFIQEFRQSGLIKDHRQGLKLYKNSFQGREFVKWVMKTKNLNNADALELGQSLIDQHYGNGMKSAQVFRDGDFYYRLLGDEDSDALNAGDVSACKPRPANQIGEEIRRLILKLYNEFLSKDGKFVDYKGIAASEQFDVFVKHTYELHRVQIEKATKEEKLAFFINIYNAMVIHGFVVRGPPSNMWQRYKFFNSVKYIIGGLAYSLQDIENGVLRGNKRGIGMIMKPFGKTDPRLKIALPSADPLIHFALVCGAKSCPPIKTYSAKNVKNELRVAGEAFLEGSDACLVRVSEKKVQLSLIFKWYRDDFGKNDTQLSRSRHFV